MLLQLPLTLSLVLLPPIHWVSVQAAARRYRTGTARGLRLLLAFENRGFLGRPPQPAVGDGAPRRPAVAVSVSVLSRGGVRGEALGTGGLLLFSVPSPPPPSPPYFATVASRPQTRSIRDVASRPRLVRSCVHPIGPGQRAGTPRVGGAAAGRVALRAQRRWRQHRGGLQRSCSWVRAALARVGSQGLWCGSAADGTEGGSFATGLCGTGVPDQAGGVLVAGVSLGESGEGGGGGRRPTPRARWRPATRAAGDGAPRGAAAPAPASSTLLGSPLTPPVLARQGVGLRGGARGRAPHALRAARAAARRGRGGTTRVAGRRMGVLLVGGGGGVRRGRRWWRRRPPGTRPAAAHGPLVAPSPKRSRGVVCAAPAGAWAGWWKGSWGGRGAERQPMPLADSVPFAWDVKQRAGAQRGG